MIVGNVHGSIELWRIWDPAFRVVRSQLDVIFDEERNAHTSCLHGGQTDIFERPEETEYVEEIGTGRDGLLDDHAANSWTCEGDGIGDHDCTDDDTNHNLPDNRRNIPACRGVRSHPPDKEDAPPVSRETVVYNQHLSCKNDKSRWMAAMTKQSCQTAGTDCIRRSQVKISANALSSWQRPSRRHPSTAIHSHTCRPWTAHNDTPGSEQ